MNDDDFWDYDHGMDDKDVITAGYARNQWENDINEDGPEQDHVCGQFACVRCGACSCAGPDHECVSDGGFAEVE